MTDLEINWQRPWEPVRSSNRGAALDQELQAEIASGHVLSGRVGEALGVRHDSDDVLYRLDGGEELAVVHLTWNGRPEPPPWPSAQVFSDARQFVDERMWPDHLQSSGGKAARRDPPPLLIAPSERGPIYAGFDKRALALLVDTGLVMAFMPLMPVVLRQPLPWAVVWLVLLRLLWLGYPIVCAAQWGRTLGKKVLGLRILRLDLCRIGYRQALLRYSVETVLMVFGIVSLAVAAANWTGPDWRSLSYFDHNLLLEQREPLAGLVSTAGMVWFGLDTLVFFCNRKRRAIHDFLAGTVVVVEPKTRGKVEARSTPGAAT